MVFQKDGSSALEDFDRWQKSFERYMRYQKRSVNTRESYGKILDKFKAFIEDHHRVEKLSDINKDIILEFMEMLEDKHIAKYPSRKEYSIKTKALYITILKTFFEYINRNCDPDETTGAVYSFEREFTDLLPKKINSKREIKHLTSKDIDKILSYLKSNEYGKKGKKTHYAHIHAIGIKLMLGAGLRITEMLSLRLSDITESGVSDEGGEKDFYDIALEKTKSGVPQSSMIRKELIESELEYFRNTIKENDYIFKGIGADKRIERNNFYVTMQSIYEKAGVNRKGLHIFRHTCAMNLQETTGNVLLVKKLLRHANIATTMVYVDADKNDLATAMRVSATSK